MIIVRGCVMRIVPGFVTMLVQGLVTKVVVRFTMSLVLRVAGGIVGRVAMERFRCTAMGLVRPVLSAWLMLIARPRLIDGTSLIGGTILTGNRLTAQVFAEHWAGRIRHCSFIRRSGITHRSHDRPAHGSPDGWFHVGWFSWGGC